MKRLTVLLSFLIVLTGGTLINSKQRAVSARLSTIQQLNSVAEKLDSTTLKLDHSTNGLKKLR